MAANWKSKKVFRGMSNKKKTNSLYKRGTNLKTRN